MKLIQTLVLGVCVVLAVAVPTDKHSVSKRQIGGTLGVGGKSIGGGIGQGFGQYDYNDYYGDYIGDYNYDYYDWVCTTNPPNCQLCNILGSECCDPAINTNCFLPDSCLNNPCLAGGTCITVTTIDGRPDFTCVCLPGLSGKYCQLATDYFVGAQFFAPPPMPIIPPFGAPLPILAPGGGVGPGMGGPGGPVAGGQGGQMQGGQQQQGYGGYGGYGGQQQQGGQGPIQGGQGQAQGGQQFSQGGVPPGGAIPYPHPGLGVANGVGRGPFPNAG
jgi:hypothetical protein